ncbi:MAG: GDP-mannose 4,6-dehydratase [Phycisphaerae bacterium]|nr:GDP-mannose 4,6-dehydratase [Phycisphaerae bacterium]
MPPRILVTGGAGFIGSHVCEALIARGDSVVALDNFDDFYALDVKRRNIADLISHDRFRIIEGDIRDAALMGSIFSEGIDGVVHLAARAGVRPSIEQPLLYEDVNVRGTLVLLEACRTRPKCRFVFASSSSVYGNRRDVPFRESDRVDDPISPYAATKKAGELICHTYHHLYGIPITCLRFFTVYGPRQRPDLAIHKFARLIESGKPVPVFGDGSMTRDFTFIADTVDGVLRALDRCDEYRIYNLGNEHPVSVMELIRALENALGRSARIEHLPLQPGDVDRTYADVSVARAELGYDPATNLADGLACFANWMRKQKL